MKLTDLDATFVDASANGFVHGPECKQGVLFDEPAGSGGKLLVWFANPIGGGPAAGREHTPSPRWTRTGETLETLTLSPSVNVIGGWHGWIRNGEVITC